MKTFKEILNEVWNPSKTNKILAGVNWLKRNKEAERDFEPGSNDETLIAAFSGYVMGDKDSKKYATLWVSKFSDGAIRLNIEGFQNGASFRKDGEFKTVANALNSGLKGDFGNDKDGVVKKEMKKQMTK